MGARKIRKRKFKITRLEKIDISKYPLHEIEEKLSRYRRNHENVYYDEKWGAIVSRQEM